MEFLSRLRFLGIVFFIFAITACGGGGDDSGTTNNPPPPPPPPPTITGSVSGQVQDANTKLPVEGVSVSVAGNTVITSATGNYTLSSVASGERIVVSIERDGYADQSKIVKLTTQGEDVALNVDIQPVDLTQAFDSSVANDLTVAGSPAMVSLPAGSLVQADGSAPAGMATVNLTVIDPTTDIELMPGDLQTAAPGGGMAQLESFGAITATFNDASGNDLNLQPGSTATIRIPVPSGTTTPPATIPLYYYDKTAGLWVEEGTATLDASGQFYEGTVSHFSTWNADQVYNRVTINGCVEDAAGTRLSGIWVYSTGLDYTGRAYTYTDASGNFSVFAKSNAQVRVQGRRVFSVTNAVDVTTGVTNVTLDSCLVLQTVVPDPGTTGGTLTLSGVDTSITGTSLVFGDVINLYAYLGLHYIYGGESANFEDTSTIDPNNTHYIYMFGDASATSGYLAITVGGIAYLYYCADGTEFANCGGGAVTFNDANRTMTFTNALMQRLQYNPVTGTFDKIDMTVNGTLNWRDYLIL